MIITKRDGAKEALDLNKIKRAIILALDAADVFAAPMPIVHRVVGRLGAGDLTVGQVVDAVEEELISSGLGSVARRFIEYRVARDIDRAARLSPDPGAVADYIHAAKYSRYSSELGRRETFSESVDRVVAMHTRRFPHLEEEIISAFQPVYRREMMPSMRSMQFGGAAVEAAHARIYNCSFTHVDRWRVFQESFYLLLAGCGVGYSVQWHHVEQLEPLPAQDGMVVHHVVADTIEGWADALGALIDGARAGVWVEFSYHLIRAKGEVLVTSGGLAPGHKPLKKMLETVRGMLLGMAGRAPRPLEAHDMLCHIAEAVLSGGIRRSSLICLFDLNDTEMVYCKSRGVFEPGGLNKQREMANNSAVCLRDSMSEAEFLRLLRVAEENYGCPGFFFTSDREEGCNPCGEIVLRPWIHKCVEHGWSKDLCCSGGVRRTGFQFCNLCDIRILSVESARKAAFIGTLQASYTSFDYLGEVSEQITRDEALLGVGITGIQDQEWITPALLRECRDAVIAENERAAGLMGINSAARHTTVKPSGTASLALGGCGPGIHPSHARRYFQRVTANPQEVQAQYFKSINPHMVEEKPNGDWSLVFPVEGRGKTVKEQPALEFCALVLMVYQNWINGHNVSCTVTLKPGEDVRGWVWEHRDSLRAMSFVSLWLDKNIPFIPKREVYPEDESKWNRIIRLYRRVDWSKMAESSDSTNLKSEPACAAGGCEIL